MPHQVLLLRRGSRGGLLPRVQGRGGLRELMSMAMVVENYASQSKWQLWHPAAAEKWAVTPNAILLPHMPLLCVPLLV